LPASGSPAAVWFDCGVGVMLLEPLLDLLTVPTAPMAVALMVPLLR
jgi:hypothetical protein